MVDASGARCPVSANFATLVLSEVVLSAAALHLHCFSSEVQKLLRVIVAIVAHEDRLAAGAGSYRPLNDSSSVPRPHRTRNIISRSNPAQISPEIEMERIRAEMAEDENRPLNRPYYQQTMRSWSLLLTPWRAAGGYLLIGLIFVPLGAFLWGDSDSIVEMR